MIRCAEHNHCDLVMCDCIKVYSDGRKTIYSHNIRGGLYEEKQLHQEYYPHLLITRSIEYPATISNCVCMVKICDKECHDMRLEFDFLKIGFGDVN